ncbi:hypothetical protein Q8F55_005352 [Vanrija albida]|uniref:Fe2OG dioxygenase domain-containing protein n=1 Tax=Vanrija albida TaxID=181172 RepID=A0ABR3Q1D7_9TREE
MSAPVPAPALTPAQLTQWEEDGYLVLPSFFDAAETGEMLARAHTLLDEFDVTGHPMTVFSTGSDEAKHVGDEYFLSSGDKIRYFLEPGSVVDGALTVPPARAVNKIGHALGVLDPVFAKYTFHARVQAVARAIGAHKEPEVLQSMVICKQPRIGGEVPAHNDSTFLYTDPPSAVGCWIALDECTPANGCLSFLPGSHKTARVSSRFVRAAAGGTEFVDVPGVEANELDWDKAEGWRQAPCPPGTLVLIHGSVMHRSPPNPSERTRMIYTFHMIEGADGWVYDERNWLQPTKEMPFTPLYEGPSHA